MKSSEIEGVGVVGIDVILNHSELVALKGFVASLKALNPDAKYDYVREAKPLVTSMIVFLEKMLPEDVMSIQDAYNELFTLPIEPEKADNEL